MNDFLETFDQIPTPQKILILLLVMIGIGVGFYLLVYSELDSDIESAQSQKRRLLKEETDLNQKVKKKKVIKDKVEELVGEKDKLKKALPKKAEISDLLKKIQGQAQLAGLDIKLFEPGDEQAQKLYTEIPVKMSLRGTYDEVANFFYYVGKLERVVNIKNISISRVSEGAYGSGELNVDCVAVTYRSGVTKKQGRK